MKPRTVSVELPAIDTNLVMVGCEKVPLNPLAVLIAYDRLISEVKENGSIAIEPLVMVKSCVTPTSARR